MKKSLNCAAIEAAMLKAGLNQSALAGKLGVSREAVSRWLRTGTAPKADKLVALAALLKLTVDDLVRDRPKMEYPLPTSSPMILREAPEAGASAVVLYQSRDEGIHLDVRLDKETIWLTQKQMSELFHKDVRTINEHIRNVFDEGELAPDSVIREYRITADDNKSYATKHYNLDVIISIGYRVKSRQGTQFRIWATSVLREHIVKGYTVNARRLKELSQTVRLIADIAERRELAGDEATALLRLAADYSFALDLLDDYDHQRVAGGGATREGVQTLDYEEAVRIIGRLRDRFGAPDLFGREKDNGLKSALGAVVQTFGGQDVYPTLEEKAANLLYFLVKNHAFVDGNKRIGAALFLWFLEKNGALYRADKTKRLADTALVAMTLLIAESKPSEKDILCRVLVHLICRGDA